MPDHAPIPAPTLASILRQDAYPILESLIPLLTLPDVYALHATCKTFRWLTGPWQKTRLHTQLTCFVANPHGFREMLGTCDGLISGGFALEFFVPGCKRAPYLDVFIQQSRADSFAQYLRDEEQYQPTPGAHVDGDGNDEDQARVILCNAERETTIRVIRTKDTPIQAVLTSSSITADVNVITRNKAYSIFPLSTIVRHECYPLRALDQQFGRVLSERARQGWTTRDLLWPDWTEKRPKEMGPRRVGDRFSLIVDFGDNFCAPSSAPDLVIEYAQFEVNHRTLRSYDIWPYGPGSAMKDQFSVATKTLDSRALRHQFTFADSSWKSFVSERLERWTLIELYKMDPEIRPRNFATNMPPLPVNLQLPSDFTAPDTWDFADDQIPSWYQEWEAQSLR